MEMTIQIPDELAIRLQAHKEHIPEVLEKGLDEIQNSLGGNGIGNGNGLKTTIDMIDYALLLGVLDYYMMSCASDTENAQIHPSFKSTPERQTPYRLVMQQYMEESISLGRAAELLEMPWVELRFRCAKLGIPVRTAPTTVAEILEDYAAALAWSKQSHV